MYVLVLRARKSSPYSSAASLLTPPALAGGPRSPARRVFNPSCTAKLTTSTRVCVWVYSCACVRVYMCTCIIMCVYPMCVLVCVCVCVCCTACATPWSVPNALHPLHPRHPLRNARQRLSQTPQKALQHPHNRICFANQQTPMAGTPRPHGPQPSPTQGPLLPAQRRSPTRWSFR